MSSTTLKSAIEHHLLNKLNVSRLMENAVISSHDKIDGSQFAFNQKCITQSNPLQVYRMDWICKRSQLNRISAITNAIITTFTQIAKGGIVLWIRILAVQKIIPLQYNPEIVTRALQPKRLEKVLPNQTPSNYGTAG
jgi:hypothetical protein